MVNHLPPSYDTEFVIATRGHVSGLQKRSVCVCFVSFGLTRSGSSVVVVSVVVSIHVVL